MSPKVGKQRLLGALGIGVAALLLGSQAHAIGIAVAVLAFLLGAASVALGQRWLGSPEESPPRYGVAALGASIAVVVSGAAVILDAPEMPYVVGGAAFALTAGLVFGLVLVKYPDPQR